MKNIIYFAVGIALTLFYHDYQKTKRHVRTNFNMAHRCSQALFDNDDGEGWNEYALSVCEDLQDVDDRLENLEGK